MNGEQSRSKQVSRNDYVKNISLHVAKIRDLVSKGMLLKDEVEGMACIGQLAHEAGFARELVEVLTVHEDLVEVLMNREDLVELVRMVSVLAAAAASLATLAVAYNSKDDPSPNE